MQAQLSLPIALVTERVYQPRGIIALQILFKKHFQSIAEQYESKYAVIYGRFCIERITEVIGLFKTEVIRCKGPWKSLESVEYATLEWVDWFNNRRLLEPIGNIPPVEFKSAYYAM